MPQTGHEMISTALNYSITLTQVVTLIITQKLYKILLHMEPISLMSGVHKITT